MKVLVLVIVRVVRLVTVEASPSTVVVMVTVVSTFSDVVEASSVVVEDGGSEEDSSELTLVLSSSSCRLARSERALTTIALNSGNKTQRSRMLVGTTVRWRCCNGWIVRVKESDNCVGTGGST